MDSKRKLKETKEAISRKDYASAKEKAKEIILQDPENYNALIFLGLSAVNLGSLAEGEEAYEKAVSLNKTNLLAYQVSAAASVTYGMTNARNV
ncbi:Superkiller protein 3 [Phlyctochytrium bullatum]|nr:Superkiller protein 3 [Phlyctochytrium bullatum]